MRKYSLCFHAHIDNEKVNQIFYNDTNSPWSDFYSQVTFINGHNLFTHDIVEEHTHIDCIIVRRLDLAAKFIYQQIKRNPYITIIFLPLEEPTVVGLHEEVPLCRLDVDIVLTWRDDLATRYRHCYLIRVPQKKLVDRSDLPSFSERKCTVAIDGAKTFKHPRESYSERRRVLKYLFKEGIDLDFYGRGWERDNDLYLSSRCLGEVEDKLSVQSEYKITICFENTNGYEGDVCEKIFDAFQARSFPIYFGASNISRIIPKGLYYDYRLFKDLSELKAYISNFSESDYSDFIYRLSHYVQSGAQSAFWGETLAETLLTKLKESQPRKRSGCSWLFHVYLNTVLSLTNFPRIRKLSSLKQLTLNILS